MQISRRDIDWPTSGLADRLLSGLAWLLSARTGKRAPSQSYSLEDYLALEKVKSAALEIRLPAEHAFGDKLDVRTGNPTDARRIAEHESVHLDPLSNERSVILGGSFDSKARYIPLLFTRAETLKAIERKAGALGVQDLRLVVDAPAPLAVSSPGTRRTARKGRRLWALAYILFAASLWAAANAYLHRQSSELAQLRAQETELRDQLAERRAAEREVSALQTLADRNVDHRTLPARLDVLSRASAATPEGARWLSVKLDGPRLEVTGLGPSAADARDALASAFPEARVAFSQSIASEDDGLQSFVIEVEPTE